MTDREAPIECATYDEFELMCIARERMAFKTMEAVHYGVPHDLRIRNGHEVIVIHLDDGGEIEIALSSILSVEPTRSRSNTG